MIGYLEGRIIHFESDKILLLAGSVGYEVLLNPGLVEKLSSREQQQETGPEDTAGHTTGLYIYYHQTERQPKPVLIGFETLDEKDFFQTFITVDAIGPMKAVKAMTRPACEMALAIEKKDTRFLTGLAGIGKRTAEKIIATLNGKVERFIADSRAPVPGEEGEPEPSAVNDIEQQVSLVLIEQLGHSPASASRMIREAFERNPAITTPEGLFDEIYQEGL